MKHLGMYAATFGLAALIGGCLDIDDPAPVRAFPSVDPVAGRTLLEPVELSEEEEEVDPTAQPTLPTVLLGTHAPLPGLNAEGSVVLVRSAP